jgi:hypothetical protein
MVHSGRLARSDQNMAFALFWLPQLTSLASPSLSDAKLMLLNRV